MYTLLPAHKTASAKSGLSIDTGGGVLNVEGRQTDTAIDILLLLPSFSHENVWVFLLLVEWHVLLAVVVQLSLFADTKPSFANFSQGEAVVEEMDSLSTETIPFPVKMNSNIGF